MKYTTIRVIQVAHYNLELGRMDIKTTFFLRDLDEVIYMNQPQGCIDKENFDHVCLLKRSLYTVLNNLLVSSTKV